MNKDIKHCVEILESMRTKLDETDILIDDEHEEDHNVDEIDTDLDMDIDSELDMEIDYSGDEGEDELYSEPAIDDIEYSEPAIEVPEEDKDLTYNYTATLQIHGYDYPMILQSDEIDDFKTVMRVMKQSGLHVEGEYKWNSKTFNLDQDTEL